MKKKIVAILLLVLIAAASVFSLAACNEEWQQISDFERNHGERYLKEYSCHNTMLYEYDEETQGFVSVVTWWDTGNPVSSSDDLRGYDYLIDYTDGDYSDPQWNALFLKGKEFVELIGKTITVNLSDIAFSGTMEAIPIIFSDMKMPGEALIGFDLSDEEKDDLFIYAFGTAVDIDYHAPSTKSDGCFRLNIWSTPFELIGKRYQMSFYYDAALEPGDTDWFI